MGIRNDFIKARNILATHRGGIKERLIAARKFVSSLKGSHIILKETKEELVAGVALYSALQEKRTSEFLSKPKDLELEEQMEIIMERLRQMIAGCALKPAAPKVDPMTKLMQECEDALDEKYD